MINFEVMLSHLAMKLYYVRLDTEQLAAEETELTKYDDGDDDDDDDDDGDDDSDGGNDDDSMYESPRKLSTIKKELIALKSCGMDLASQRSSLILCMHTCNVYLLTCSLYSILKIRKIEVFWDLASLLFNTKKAHCVPCIHLKLNVDISAYANSFNWVNWSTFNLVNWSTTWSWSAWSSSTCGSVAETGLNPT